MHENVRLKCVFGIPLSSESLVCVDTPKRAVRLNMEMARKISVRNPRKPPSSKRKNPKSGVVFHLRIRSASVCPDEQFYLTQGTRQCDENVHLFEPLEHTKCYGARVRGVGTWK